jgi:2'-5' RNA ligase
MRLFLALELPPTVRDEIRRAQSELKGSHTGWRWVRPENVHLTLRFLGEVDRSEADRHLPRWREVAQRCSGGTFRVEGAGVFPPRGRPRVLWTGILDPDPARFLDDLAATLESAARDLGFPAESRPFRAHLTIGRSGRGGRATVPGPQDIGPLGEVAVEEVVLFRSELRREGAVYTVLDRFPLSADRGRNR